MTEFRDGPDINWVKQQLDLEEGGFGEGTGVELSSEDLELKFEEDLIWNDSETSEIEGEDPEYAQLRREELQELLDQLE
jgi:hypothetical protein